MTLLLTAVTGAWADTNPDYESYDWNETQADAVVGTHGNVVITGSLGTKGNVSGHWYLPIANNLKNSDDPWAGYLGISSSKQIEKVQILYCPNGTNKTDLAWVAWGENVTPNQYTLGHGTTTGTTGSKSWDAKVWETIDLSEIEAYTVYISRSIREFREIGGSSNISNFGSGNTVNVLGIRVWLKDKDTRDPLTLSFTPDNKNIAVDGNLATSLSWSEDTSSESTKYTTTYTSSDDAIATVNSSGVVTGVAAGTATITATVTAAADATYKTTTKSITVNVVEPLALNANFSTPSAVLDLSDADAASTLLVNTRWIKDNPYFGNDGVDNYVVISPYCVYQDAPTWSAVPNNGEKKGGSSSTVTWDATDVFLGSSYYIQEDSKARYATTRNDRAYNKYSYRVKGVSKIKLLYKSGGNTVYANLGVFEITAGTPASTTMLFAKGNNNTLGVLTVEELDPAKEYLIALDNNSTTSTSLYEVALYYDTAVDMHASVSPSKTYTTYVTTTALDFTGLDIEAYVATAATTTTVTMEKVTTVPSKTPLVLKKVSGSTFDIPVIAQVAAPATNLLKAGDGKTDVGGDGVYDYLLSNGLFYHISPAGAIAKGKAYLHLDAAPAESPAPELSVVFEDGDTEDIATGIQTIDNGQLTKDNAEFYNLNGQRITQPTKGLYIVNGKKVVIK